MTSKLAPQLRDGNWWRDRGIDVSPYALMSEDVRLLGQLDRLHVGDFARIDSGCLLSIGPEGIHIGQGVHVAADCRLYGGGGKIELLDCVGLSAGVSVFTASDDYTGGNLIGPAFPPELRKVKQSRVVVSAAAAVGAHAVLLPGAYLEFGAAVGAGVVVGKRVRPGHVMAGCPPRKVAQRDLDELRANHAQALQHFESQRDRRVMFRAFRQYGVDIYSIEAFRLHCSDPLIENHRLTLKSQLKAEQLVLIPDLFRGNDRWLSLETVSTSLAESPPKADRRPASPPELVVFLTYAAGHGWVASSFGSHSALSRAKFE